MEHVTSGAGARNGYSSTDTARPERGEATTFVEVSKPQPGITWAKLNRPERLNALTAGLVDELRAALDDVAADPDCQVLILTGTG